MAADGDEPDVPLVDPGPLGVGDEPGVEVQPRRVAARDGMPELDAAYQFAGLVRPGQVGVGVAQHAARGFVGEDGEDARASLAAQGGVSQS
jgi:hypothetical protein